MQTKSGTIPDTVKDVVVTALSELSVGATAWNTMNGPITRESLIEEVKQSSSLGQQFCTELLRVARDLIVRQAAEEASYERVSAPSPRVPTLEWLKSLTALVWDGEERNAEGFAPLLTDEDIADYEKSGEVPTLEMAIECAEGSGDRVLEIRTAEGDLVYNGRKAFEAELTALQDYWKP
ncbi:hypothetical protein HFN89_06210 [Rhizobium laguerreae]|nr:hypothetical protein [Rhizobium laguerreae]